MPDWLSLGGMNFTRAQKIQFLMGLVIVGLVVYGIVLWQDNAKYAGLVTHEDTGLTAASRSYIEGQLNTAQAALAAQISATPDDVDLDLYMTAAWHAAALGDLVLAREIYEDYFTLHAINAAAWNHYGSILMRMEDYVVAEEAFRTAGELAPSEENYRDLITAVGNTAPDGTRDDEIKLILEAGVINVGQTPWFMTELASWYLNHGDCDRAIDHYEVAKGLLPVGNEAILQDLQAAKERCAE